ncbi:DUF4264 family protein [Salimicrobium halophilum]|uniref:DUF4264 domain-containing protein n=1 Tax=Salimicrobium halophilum TaxID=86666 RepID=A0A1G8Q1R6_9BACI|nr:DUF4264 family protein [Salimicrobium halophilum]SDI98672.1 Protein of unknown function [Salimicrobium halophilum]
MSQKRVISSLEISYCEDLYKVTDGLNKALKTKDVIVGLSLKDDETAILTVYES